MTRRLDIRPQAYFDIVEIADYIARDRPASARKFITAAEQTCRWLLRNPDAGRLYGFEHPLAADVRSWGVKGFKNYLIFYQSQTWGIEVVRVIHGARNLKAIFGGKE